MGQGYIVHGYLTGLTPAEKAYLLLHPHHIGTISDDADAALAAARRNYPGAGQHNGLGDAFRHAYWSALLARDIGADNARAFTTAHEGFSDNPAPERAMDLHNNGVGIAIAAEAGPGATDAQLESRVRAAIASGRLMTAPPATGAPY